MMLEVTVSGIYSQGGGPWVVHAKVTTKPGLDAEMLFGNSDRLAIEFDWPQGAFDQENIKLTVHEDTKFVYQRPLWLERPPNPGERMAMVIHPTDPNVPLPLL